MGKYNSINHRWHEWGAFGRQFIKGKFNFILYLVRNVLQYLLRDALQGVAFALTL